MKQRLRLSREAWRRVASKLDPSRVQASWSTRITYGAAAIANSVMARLQTMSNAEALQKVEILPPIFLLGFWRSGTTFLHELFCCDSRFGFPSTYACMNPHHFLLSEKSFHKRVRSQPSLRPMDNMQFSWSSPQEDEFALLCMGALSPYEALLAPSLMCDAESLLDPRKRPANEPKQWAETLQLFLRLLTVQQEKPMVLKSPPHGYRLPILPSLFPEARFVIIERNPYEVFASNLKLWRTLLDMYSLESLSPGEIQEFVLRAYLIHEQLLKEGNENVPRGKMARVRYEDLTANPLLEMRRIYSELGLTGFDEARPALEHHIGDVTGHKRNRFVLSPEQRNAVESRWGALIQEKSYSWSEDWISLQA